MKKTLLAIVTACMLAGASVAAHGAEPVDAATAQAVKELLVLINYRDQLAAGLQRASASLPQVLLKVHTDRVNNNSKLTDDQKRAELAIVSNDIPKLVNVAQRMVGDPKLIDDIVDEIVPIYARQFTLAELKELAAFYKTPTAIKMQKLMPLIMQEANQASQTLMKARMAKLVEDITKRK